MKELCLNVWYLFLIILMFYILVDMIIVQPIQRRKNKIKAKNFINELLENKEEKKDEE